MSRVIASSGSWIHVPGQVCNESSASATAMPKSSSHKPSRLVPSQAARPRWEKSVRSCVRILGPLGSLLAGPQAQAAIVAPECEWIGYYDPLNLASTAGQLVATAIVTGASYVSVTCAFEQQVGGSWQYIGYRNATMSGGVAYLVDPRVGFSPLYPTRLCTSVSSDRGTASLACVRIWPLV